MKRIPLCSLALALAAGLAANAPPLKPPAIPQGVPADAFYEYAPLHDSDGFRFGEGSFEIDDGPDDSPYVPDASRYVPPDAPATPRYGDDGTTPYMTPVWDRYEAAMPAPELEEGRTAYMHHFAGFGTIPQIDL